MSTAARLLVFVAACGALSAAQHSELQTELQSLMDDLAAGTGFGLQLGYIDEQGELSLAAGTKPDKSTKVSPDDTFMFGSGTKPFTAALTLKLQEEGKLSLDDPAQKYVDPVLKAMSGTDRSLSSMAAILGPQAAEVTVGQVIRMQSGIQDFDLPSCDNPVLEDGKDEHSPLVWVKCLAS